MVPFLVGVGIGAIAAVVVVCIALVVRDELPSDDGDGCTRLDDDPDGQFQR